VLKPLFYRDIDEKKELKYTRIIILLLGIFSLSTALYIDGIIKSLLLALTVYTSGIIIPVVFGFYREKLSLNAAGAVSACIAGGGSALIMKISGMDQFLVYIFSAAVIILFAVSRICGKYINSKA
jgi:Na+/proline symporter